MGGTFSAFGGAIGGENLAVIPGESIIQLWRAAHWMKQD